MYYTKSFHNLWLTGKIDFFHIIISSGALRTVVTRGHNVSHNNSYVNWMVWQLVKKGLRMHLVENIGDSAGKTALVLVPRPCVALVEAGTGRAASPRDSFISLKIAGSPHNPPVAITQVIQETEPLVENCLRKCKFTDFRWHHEAVKAQHWAHRSDQTLYSLLSPGRKDTTMVQKQLSFYNYQVLNQSADLILSLQSSTVIHLLTTADIFF